MWSPRHSHQEHCYKWGNTWWENRRHREGELRRGHWTGLCRMVRSLLGFLGDSDQPQCSHRDQVYTATWNTNRENQTKYMQYER